MFTSPHPWTWPWILRSITEIAVSQEWEGRLTWNERDVNWIWCWTTIGLTLDHGAWQKDRPSNGSMWNSYSFQPVGPWMGYSFTDLGAEGYCRSLNALIPLSFVRICIPLCNVSVNNIDIFVRKVSYRFWLVNSSYRNAITIVSNLWGIILLKADLLYACYYDAINSLRSRGTYLCQ